MKPANLLQLTKREKEVLKMLAVGQQNKEIAQCLKISVATTQNHLQNLYKKLRVRNRTEAAEKYRSMEKVSTP
ncbi:MAG: LuxR C-terminal-related transcriptional regulator [Anaerolineales bacterium]